ncbi:MAG TPA: hypothetical protein VH558_07055 [Pseudolabrys sp.]|jgi:hypothetical protein
MNSFDNDPVRNLPLVTQPRPGPKRAAWWQIALTTVAVVAIVAIFLWGINNQHEEGADQQTAAKVTSPAMPEAPSNAGAPQDQSQKATPSTTGQGGSQGNSQGGGEPQGGSANKDHQPLDSNGEPAQPQRK